MNEEKNLANQFHGVVKGRVQGVGYRIYALRAAESHGVAGWVRNLPTGDVEVHAEGNEDSLTEFLTDLYKGPVMAYVRDIEIEWKHGDPQCERFEIRR